MQKQVKIDGFRPGKVPLNVVKQKYGTQVQGEALEAVIDRTANEALEQEGLRPALKPNIEIESFEEGKDLSYKISF